MTIANAKKHLKRILKQNHMPVLLWSGPGIGKSSIVKQIAEEFGWKFIDIRLPLLMPSDLIGIPFPDTTHTKANWLWPSFFPEPNSKENILILFDEIGNASMNVQNSCYRIILDRSIGEHYKFPENVRMVAASNRELDKSGVGKFSAALANRFIHFFIEPDLDSWKSWGLQNGINEKIIGFLNFKQNLLCIDPQKLNIEDKAYPTPRSWEKVSNLLDWNIWDDDVIAGTVGKGTASEFFSYLEVYAKLPDVDKILAGEKVEVPKEPSVLYALSSSLVVKADKNNVENIFNFTEKIPAEFQVLTIRDIARKDDTILRNLDKFLKWMANNKKYFDDENGDQ